MPTGKNTFTSITGLYDFKSNTWFAQFSTVSLYLGTSAIYLTWIQREVVVVWLQLQVELGHAYRENILTKTNTWLACAVFNSVYFIKTRERLKEAQLIFEHCRPAFNR